MLLLGLLSQLVCATVAEAHWNRVPIHCDYTDRSKCTLSAMGDGKGKGDEWFPWVRGQLGLFGFICGCFFFFFFFFVKFCFVVLFVIFFCWFFFCVFCGFFVFVLFSFFFCYVMES